MGTDGSFGNEDSDKSVLSAVGKSITPIFSPMGLDQENWPATVGIFTGIFAKEAVVGTLDALYGQMDVDAAGSSRDEQSFDFLGGITEAFLSIQDNLMGMADTALDPLGLSIGDTSATETAAREQGVSLSTFGAMAVLFDGKIGAFAYLLFILLYFPCVAAIAAVYRETDLKWTAFAGAWTTGLAYMAAVIFYQAATITRNPGSSLAWIIVMCGLFIGVVMILRQVGKNDAKWGLRLQPAGSRG